MNTYRGVVYPWQCDHMGHQNVMWYVGKFDEATWNLFASIGVTPSYLRDSNRGMVAVEQHITYKQELVAGDTVFVTSAIVEVRDKVIRFEHQMFNAETQELAAVTKITGVHLDREARKSCPLPTEVLALAKTALRQSHDDA